MIVTILLLLMIGSSMSSVEVTDANRRAKRIAFGNLLPSLDTYKTYYFVQLRRAWACVTDQTNHEDSLTRCQEDYNLCGGALIHPEFVVTAGHCVMYYEVELKNKFVGDESWVQDWKDHLYYSLIDAWDRLKHTVVGIFIVPKPRHTVYTDWALFVGSHDMYNMKQKRHVVKVFPHKNFPQDLSNDEKYEIFEETKNSYHDIAVLQACEPFKIKSGQVELAPMMRTQTLMREQFKVIVNTGMVCLYIGFGAQDNDEEEARKSGYPLFSENLMLHAWRPTSCSAVCNKDYRIKGTPDHACHMCSRAHGSKLATPEAGDSGSPVTCAGKYVATYTGGSVSLARNGTRADSYPIFCIMNSITEERLNYYKTVNKAQYHPLSGTRLRRFPLPQE